MGDWYIFIDESGNFDFSEKGSRYFVLCAVVTDDPVQGVGELLTWRHHLLSGETPRAGAAAIRKPRDCTHFHCTADDQYTRNGVFSIVGRLRFDAYATIVRKNKADPGARVQDTFYQSAFERLVPLVVRRHGGGRAVHVFVSDMQLKSKRAAFVAALKSILNADRGVYRLHFHPNHSHHLLQVADYVCWAIARKWERQDTRSYAHVSAHVRAELEMNSGRTQTCS